MQKGVFIMFLGPPPNHQRRPNTLFDPFQRPVTPPTKKSQILSELQTSVKQIDLEKVVRSVEQMTQLYQQVNPLISKFTKR